MIFSNVNLTGMNKTKSVKKYSTTAFKLWKKNDKGKWIFYNAVFDYADITDLNYQSACRLIKKSGWIPYAIAAIPEKHQPIQLPSSDYQALESHLKEIDPVSQIVGDAVKKFLNKPKVKKTETPGINKKAYDLALERAIQAYKHGEWVSPHLLPKVISMVTKHDN
ncbi:hypothetical protein [Nostoc phage N1]|nr:hypothetical protein [Nostoc phage N1]